MPEQIEALTAVLEADIRKFEKGMGDAFKVFDQRSAAIEKRQESLMRKLNTGFALGNIGRTLVGGAALYGLEQFVSSIADTATKIQTTAQAIGVGTDALQEWGRVASHSGVDQESFNTALDRFAKNLGEAQIKGGAMAQLLKGLGVDIHANTETAFLQFSDAIASTGSQSQKTALVVQLLGRNAAGLVPFMQQGAAAIKAQGDEIKRTGGIIDEQGIKKIHEAEIAWKDLKAQLTVTGANVISGFAPEFETFADQLKSPEFQDALKTFGKLLADIAITFAKLAENAPIVIAALAGLKVGGLPGAAIAAGGLAAYGVFERQTGQRSDSVETISAKLRDASRRAASERGTAQKGAAQEVAALTAQLSAAIAASQPADTTSATAPKGNLDRSNLLSGADSAKAVAKAAEDAAKAYQELVKAIDAGNVEILKGTLSVFAEIRKQITDDAQAELQTAEAERNAKLAALSDELKKGSILESDAAKIRNDLNAESASKEAAILAEAQSKRLQTLRDEVNARFDANQSVVEQRRETVKSEQGLILELAKGSQDYYKLARDLSDEQAKLDEQNIRDRLAHELSALDQQKADADKAGRDFSDYQQMRENAVTTANLKIQAIENGSAANRVRLNEEETHAPADQIQLMDGVRNGLENIGTSALHGAASFKSAVLQMIEQLAEMALKLYVLKPLVESVFGRSGTDGNFLLKALGIAGSIGGGPTVAPVSSVPFAGHGFAGGFASGGTLDAGQWGIAGEHGPEPIFAGRNPLSVIPKMPGIPSVSAARPSITMSITNQNSFAGAVDAKSMQAYADQVGEASAIRAVQTIKQNLPGMMLNVSQRTF